MHIAVKICCTLISPRPDPISFLGHGGGFNLTKCFSASLSAGSVRSASTTHYCMLFSSFFDTVEFGIICFVVVL